MKIRNYKFGSLHLPYFVHATVAGGDLTVMTFVRDAAAEDYVTSYGKAIVDNDLAIAEFDAIPEDERSPRVRPTDLPPPHPAMWPLTREQAQAVLDPSTREDHNPGSVFAAADIGCDKGGLWRCIQWDTYRHGRETHTGIQEWVLTCDQGGFVFAPYDRRAIMVGNKDKGASDLRRMERSLLAFVMVPFGGKPLSECSIFINYNPEIGLWTNVDVGYDDPEHGIRDVVRLETHPIVKLTTPSSVAPGEVADVEVYVTVDGEPCPENVSVNLMASLGYLSKKRVLVKNGKARCSVRALDLEDGDVIDVTASLDGDLDPVTAHIKVEAHA